MKAYACIRACGRNGESPSRPSLCTECRPLAAREKSDRWRRKNAVALAARRRGYNLRAAYGITVEDYDRMLAEQGGRCASCNDQPRGQKPLCVDHCHETGRVRGLLCSNCNTSLGKLRDDPRRIRGLLRYAEEVCA